MSPIGAKPLNTDTPGDVFAEPPHEHRDLPRDVRTSDTTCRIESWAENDNDGIISPVAALTLRPRDRSRADITDIDDDFDPNGSGLTNTCIVEFTVLK